MKKLVQDDMGRFILVETDEDIQVSDDEPYGIRIVVPKEVISRRMDLLVFKSWADLMNLPVETDEVNVYLYCNEILPVHQAYIESIPEIVVERR